MGVVKLEVLTGGCERDLRLWILGLENELGRGKREVLRNNTLVKWEIKWESRTGNWEIRSQKN